MQDKQVGEAEWANKDNNKPKSKLRNIPYLYQTQSAYKAIQHYLSLPRTTLNSHLSLVSALFDNTRGTRRAIAYLKLLDNSETVFQKTIILYTLLSSSKGNQLKHQVAIGMGFSSSEKARAHLQQVIYDQLQSSGCKELIALLENTVMPSMIKSANKNRIYHRKDYINDIDNIKYIAKKAGFLSTKMPRLIIDEKSELFIALCTLADDVHSFLVIGIHDNDRHENHLLCAVGKAYDTEAASELLDIFSKGYPAKANPESHCYVSGKVEINYKAFSMSIEHYGELLSLLGSVQKPLFAYQPSYKENDEFSSQIPMAYKKIPSNDESIDERSRAFLESLSFINLKNTCRHSSILLLDSLFQEGYSKTGISTNFLKKPPFLTRIKYGTVKEEIFIFPLLPQQNSPLKNDILLKLYKQLEQIPKKYRDNKDTLKKFSELKKLYLTLQENPESSIKDFFTTIRQWQITHQDLIRKKRGLSFFSTTATEDMFKEIGKLEERSCNPTYRIKG